MKKVITVDELITLIEKEGWYHADGLNEPFHKLCNMDPHPNLKPYCNKDHRLHFFVEPTGPNNRMGAISFGTLQVDAVELTASLSNGDLIESIIAVCIGENKQHMAEAENKRHEYAVRVAEKNAKSLGMSAERVEEFRTKVVSSEDIADIQGIFIHPGNLVKNIALPT